jgi:hypothetical protein
MPLAGGFPAYAERCKAVDDRGYEGFSLGAPEGQKKAIALTPD